MSFKYLDLDEQTQKKIRKMEAVLDNTYMWNVLDSLSLRGKMEVIRRLSSSIADSLAGTIAKPKENNPLAASYGIWGDEKEYSTEKLISDINAMACDNDDLFNELLK